MKLWLGPWCIEVFVSGLSTQGLYNITPVMIDMKRRMHNSISGGVVSSCSVPGLMRASASLPRPISRARSDAASCQCHWAGASRRHGHRPLGLASCSRRCDSGPSSHTDSRLALVACLLHDRQGRPERARLWCCLYACTWQFSPPPSPPRPRQHLPSFANGIAQHPPPRCHISFARAAYNRSQTVPHAA